MQGQVGSVQRAGDSAEEKGRGRRVHGRRVGVLSGGLYRGQRGPTGSQALCMQGADAHSPGYLYRGVGWGFAQRRKAGCLASSGATYLHGDDPQLLDRQPAHLARQHLRLVQDGEIGFGPGAQKPARDQAEQPEGRPQRPGPGRLLFLRLAGHAASPNSLPTGSGRQEAGRGRCAQGPLGAPRKTFFLCCRLGSASRWRRLPNLGGARLQRGSAGGHHRRAPRRWGEEAAARAVPRARRPHGPRGAEGVSESRGARRPGCAGPGADSRNRSRSRSPSRAAGLSLPASPGAASRQRRGRAAARGRRSGGRAARLGQPPERGGKGKASQTHTTERKKASRGEREASGATTLRSGSVHFPAGPPRWLWRFMELAREAGKFPRLPLLSLHGSRLRTCPPGRRGPGTSLSLCSGTGPARAGEPTDLPVAGEVDPRQRSPPPSAPGSPPGPGSTHRKVLLSSRTLAVCLAAVGEEGDCHV